MAEQGVSRATAVATAAAETLILHTPVVGQASQQTSVAALPGISQTVNSLIRGVLNITQGTSGTAVVVRCRRGNGTGGALVGVAQTHTLAAAASANIAFCFQDAGAPESDYSITVACTSLTVAGAVNEIVASISDY